MAKAEVYGKALDTEDLDEIVEEFIGSIVDTNRGYNFFVDWNKVINNAKKHRVEINILNSLLGSRNLEDDFRNLLKRYPEVTPVIPILIAVRDLRLKVVEDFSAPDINIMNFDFSPRKELSETEIDKIFHFCKKAGILYLFADKNIRNLEDYVFGVEVGMDTNARKNRSGKAMEMLLEPEIQRLNEKYGFDFISQNRFFKLRDAYPSLNIPAELRDRKFDFVLIKGDRAVNIEVNYYAGGGSKPQEIVDSYINRMNDLKAYDWEFIWVTDGDGWLSGKNQIQKAFVKQDYILNINFIRRGILEAVFDSLFG